MFFSLHDVDRDGCTSHRENHQYADKRLWRM